MISIVLTVICAVVVIAAAVRIVRVRDDPLGTRLWAALGGLGLAKLFRTPVITDDYIDVWFHSLTGLWNICDWSAMTLAALSCILVANTLTALLGIKFSDKLLYGGGLIVVLGMGVSFWMSEAVNIQTSYMSNDVPFDWWFGAYWVQYQTVMGISALVLAIVTARAAFSFRRSPTRTAMFSLAVGGLIGCLYMAHKAANIVGLHWEPLAWYVDIAPTVTVWTTLLMLLSVVLAMVLMAINPLRQRIDRYRLLRRYLATWADVSSAQSSVVLDRAVQPGESRREAWKASRDPVAAHRMMVEISDGDPGRSRAKPDLTSSSYVS